MLVSNEFEEAWLDEGMNAYYEMLVMEEAFPPYFIDLGELELSGFDFEHAGLASGRYRDPVVAPAWRYYSGGSYGQNSYMRSAITLRHLEELLGPATFARAMRAYFQRYQFRHPSTADFEATLAAETGRDLDEFFLQALHSTRTLDYAVRKVENDQLRKPAGFFWRNNERVEVERGAAAEDDADKETAP